MLEHVAIALGRHHAEVVPKLVVPDHRGFRRSPRGDIPDPGSLTERGDQRSCIGCRRDHVEIAHGLSPPPDASRLRDGDRRGMYLELLDHTPDRRESHAKQTPWLRLLAGTCLERLQDLLLAPLTKTR